MNSTEKNKGAKFYSPLEESINVGSHALGVVLSVVALILLVIKATELGETLPLVSVLVFGLSLICLYSASTIYHSSKRAEARARLRVVDHAAIYILISGTYTPFALITLGGKTGWLIFAASWSMALIGIILKLFFTGRFSILSTSLYVFMGWVIVFAIDPLVENLTSAGIQWLVAGGIAYTLGAIIYSVKKIKLNHAIFHVFVLVGSLCHFISVYYYVLDL